MCVRTLSFGMIFKGSLTQCIVSCADTFKNHSNLLLAIVCNPRAKYYTVEDDKSLDNYDLVGKHKHLRLVFFGTLRELLIFSASTLQTDILWPESTPTEETECQPSEDSGNQATQ